MQKLLEHMHLWISLKIRNKVDLSILTRRFNNVKKYSVWCMSQFIMKLKIKNKYDINPIKIGKRQLHFIRSNHALFHLNKLSKDTAFMFMFTSFSFVKLTASKNF